MTALNIQVRQIAGDLAELFFNPREVDLRVGETLTLHEHDSGRSVIVQLIAFRSATYPALLSEQLHSLIGPEPVRAPLLEAIGFDLTLPVHSNGHGADLGNIKVALAKIRKTVAAPKPGKPARWEQWDGWIPARDVQVFRTDDDEVFANSTRDLGHPLRLGRTLAGHNFFVEGQDLEKVNVITGVKGSGKCVVAGTLIPTQLGLQPIEQLCPEWQPGWNRLPEPVWVQTPQGTQPVESFYAGGEQNTRRICTRQGFTLEGTPEHPVWCRDRSGQASWKVLGDLTPDDYVAIQRHAPLFGSETDLSGFQPTPLKPRNYQTRMPILPKQLDEEIGYLLGLLIGDGSVAYPAPSGRVDLTGNDPELHQAFRAWASRIGLSVSTARTKPVTLFISNVVHREWLLYLGVERAKSIHKSVPESILRAPREIVRAFLQGLFDTDGSAWERGVEYGTSSAILARQVHLLLLKFGIVARRVERKELHAWRLILGGDNARKFFDEIGFRLPRKQERRALLPAVSNTNIDIIPYFHGPVSAEMAEALGSYRNYARGHATPSYGTMRQMATILPEAAETLNEPPYFWDRVTTIEEGRAPVFDLHVPGPHAFVTNGIVSHNSHLSKVVLLQLIASGAPCVVFDINKEYIHLPKAETDPETGKLLRRGIVHLEAGGNFRLSVRQFGLAPMLTLMTRFGLPEVSSLYFENRVARLWAEAESLEREGREAPYIGLEQLMQMAEENEFGGGSSATVVNHAIRSRLEALRNTRIFSRSPREAASLRESYQKIREGGALVVDVSGLSNLAREGFVQAIIELVKDLCMTEINNNTHRFPFIFFEEAHLYVSRQSIDYIVTRARHLGITSFFVTNMIHGLDEAVLRQADNLFLLRIPFEDDVRHVSRGAATDYETMAAFVRRLRQRHALVIGNVTAQYPLMFEVDPLDGVNTAGETRYFFR